MRLLRFLLWCAALGILVILALLVLIQNLHTEQLVFFGVVYVTNFALAMLGAIGFGFLLALVLLVPGRVAAALYRMTLERELRQFERQVATLSDQRERLLDGQERLLLRYERLFADHDRAVAERDRMRAKLDAVKTSVSQAVAVAAPAASPASAAVRAAAPSPIAAPSAAPLIVDKPRVVPAVSVRSARVLPPVAPTPAPVVDASSTPVDQPPAVAPAASPAHTTGAGRPWRGVTLENITAPLDRWRGEVARWGARVRQSTGAMYNDMRESLSASSRALVRPHARQDASYDETDDIDDTSASSAAGEDEHEDTTLKGE